MRNYRGKALPVAEVDEGGSLSKGILVEEGSRHRGSQLSLLRDYGLGPFLEAQLAYLLNSLG